MSSSDLEQAVRLLEQVVAFDDYVSLSDPYYTLDTELREQIDNLLEVHSVQTTES